MIRKSLYIERTAPILLTGGLFLHLVNLSHYLKFHENGLREIFTPIVDGPLALVMVWTAIGFFFWRNFFDRFAIVSRWRKVGYFVIAFYVVMSVPGHLYFLTTGNTAYFDAFPWWISVTLLPVYVAIIAYFVTLNEAPTSGASR